MGRRSRLLTQYQSLLVDLVVAIDTIYGYPEGPQRAGLSEDLERPTWWRWLTGKRLCSRKNARHLVNLALRDPTVGTQLTDESMDHLITIFGQLDEPVHNAAEAIVHSRLKCIKQLRAGATCASELDERDLAERITALAEKQEAFIRNFKARDPLAVSKIYEMAQSRTYFDDLETDKIQSQLIDDIEYDELDDKPDTRELRFRQVHVSNGHRDATIHENGSQRLSQASPDRTDVDGSGG